MDEGILLSVILAIVTGFSGASSVPVQAEGMFCEPGQTWTTVDSGMITGDGWSVVNFTKPEGGQMKITWTYEDFDDGPATAGFWFATDPSTVVAGGSLHTSDQATGIDARTQAAGIDKDQRLTFHHDQVTSGYAGQAEAILGAALEDENLHILQYAAGEDRDGWTLSWELSHGNCLNQTPATGVASGPNATLLTQEDLNGTLATEATASSTPARGPDGARAFVDATATRTIDGVPFIDLYWYNHAGEIQLHGPHDVSREGANCYDREWYTWCLAWGSWADPGTHFEPGTYSVDVTGFTDPTQEPTGPTRGPYMLFVPTQLPSQAPTGAKA